MPEVRWRLRGPENWFGDLFVKKEALSYVFRGVPAYTNGHVLTIYPHVDITQLWYRIDYTYDNLSYVHSDKGYDWAGDVVYYGVEHGVLVAGDRASHPMWWVDEPNSLPYKTNFLCNAGQHGTNSYQIVNIEFTYSSTVDNTRQPTYVFGDLPCFFVPSASQTFNSFPFSIQCVIGDESATETVEFSAGFDGMVQINVTEHHDGASQIPDYLEVTFDRLFEGEIPFLEKTTP